MMAGSSHGLNAHQKTPDEMKSLFKKYQRASTQELETDGDIILLDGKSLHPALTKYSQIEIDALLLAYEHLIELLDRLLHRDLSNPDHKTNLHLHYDVSLFLRKQRSHKDFSSQVPRQQRRESHPAQPGYDLSPASESSLQAEEVSPVVDLHLQNASDDDSRLIQAHLSYSDPLLVPRELVRSYEAKLKQPEGVKTWSDLKEALKHYPLELAMIVKAQEMAFVASQRSHNSSEALKGKSLRYEKPPWNHSLFRADLSSTLEPEDPKIHKNLTLQRALESKLRWMTLGRQYDWTAKEYPTYSSAPFPQDLYKSLNALFPKVHPQAAIMNIYSPGDVLGVHRDVSEECDTDLISLSIGCDAIFIVGSEEGLRTATLRLRSGDALVMSGPSRFAWHAVPKVVAGTCPEFLQDWPVVGGHGSNFKVWKGWMANKRINLNVRQVEAFDQPEAPSPFFREH